VRAVVQRVSSASVSADRLVRKLRALRVFEDAGGRMNLSLEDTGGELLCVSNFTVYGDTRKGNRPSFVEAAAPEEAERLYERVLEGLAAKGGRFGAHMAIELVNDGPVTVILDT
jgi:D-aminoacyl-tRNA deacylase